MEPWYLLFVLVPLGFALFRLHVHKYKQALVSLESRGVNVQPYRVTPLVYGASGCMVKIRRLKETLPNRLTPQENSLLDDSIRCYYMQVGLLLACIALVVVPFFI